MRKISPGASSWVQPCPAGSVTSTAAWRGSSELSCIRKLIAGPTISVA